MPSSWESQLHSVLDLGGVLASTESLYLPFPAAASFLPSCYRMRYMTFDRSNWFDRLSFYDHWHSVIVKEEA